MVPKYEYGKLRFRMSSLTLSRNDSDVHMSSSSFSETFAMLVLTELVYLTSPHPFRLLLES